MVANGDDSMEIAVNSTFFAIRSVIRVVSLIAGSTAVKAATSRATFFSWTVAVMVIFLRNLVLWGSIR